ncbi:MAG: DUF4143 domain-containing protein [Bifidobacteriaceae bacterium]|jgi:predicted AAA+ superfamily ATPase|nr:DUF4143 domain-containing protein [Bifidobacteriaceae bacterium]
MEYVPRVIDSVVESQLKAAGAVLIRGPKGCGKTETGRHHSRSELAVEDNPRVRAAMEAEPGLLLRGETPRLIDEWQVQPRIWNAVRREVDRRHAKGKFILTGSSTPPKKVRETLHSGVGRFGLIDMRTMSWAELGWSEGTVRLADLAQGKPVQPTESDLDLDSLADHLAVGGWPGSLGLGQAAAEEANANYFELLVESDASRARGVRRDPAKIRATLESLARNVSTEASLATLASDAGGAAGPLADQTIADYLEAFRELMVLEDLPAWNTHIRSSARLRKRPKWHLADPSLCCAALGLTPPQLVADLEYMGLLFESAVIHDLRVYATSTRGRVSYYRDSNGLEADAIIEFPRYGWIACEIKLGFGAADRAAESLKRFAANIDQARVGPPAALLVITGSGLAHTRPDGVHIVPMGCLA